MGKAVSKAGTVAAGFKQQMERGDANGAMKLFSGGSTPVATFFNAQDRNGAVAFVGSKQVTEFLKILSKTLPKFNIDFGLPDPLPSKGEQSNSKESPNEGEEQGENGEVEKHKTEVRNGNMSAIAEAEDLAFQAAQGEDATLISSFFNDAARVCILTYKCPAKGYRFVQETFIVDSGGAIVNYSIVMDSATDFSGISVLECASSSTK